MGRYDSGADPKAPKQVCGLAARYLVIKSIGRQGRQARVFDRSSGREVIERLKACVIESHDLVNRVVEKTADARGADSGRLGFQIEHLTDQPCLPEESAIKPWPVLAQAGFELRNHPQGKGTLPGDVLTAAELGSQGSRIALLKQEQRQAVGTSRRRAPVKLWVRCGA
jgi:hypothetical protein